MLEYSIDERGPASSKAIVSSLSHNFLVLVIISSGGPRGQQENSQITALRTKRIDVGLQQPLSIFVAMHCSVVANQLVTGLEITRAHATFWRLASYH